MASILYWSKIFGIIYVGLTYLEWVDKQATRTRRVIAWLDPPRPSVTSEIGNNILIESREKIDPPKVFRRIEN